MSVEIAEMAYRIRKNPKNSGKNDELIESIAGVYRSFEHAIEHTKNFKVFRLSDRSARLYDPEMTEREIGTDTKGSFAVGFIEAV